MKRTNAFWALVCGALAAGCVADTGDGDDTSAADDPFASGVATLMELDFDGELYATSGVNMSTKVRAQLIYTVGHLNQEHGVARLNAVKLTNMKSAYIGGGLYRIRYHARLPIAWGSKDDLPTQYTLTLPKRVDTTGQAAFLAEYGQTCTEHDGHALTSANVWYYYRPGAAGCTFEEADVTTSVAQVLPSTLNTSGKYPEYHRIWEDGVLDVLAVFGKNEKDATSDWDAGISAYNQFVAAVQDRFPNAATTPMSFPDDPGVDARDITFDVELDDGRLNLVVILVDEVKTAPASFNARFAELTPRADLIIYGGHAGLGANVQALTGKAQFFPAKYQLLFLNGCDTFAYENDALINTRKTLNPSDPGGSKYMDVMRNAMPAYFHRLADSALAVVDAAVDRHAPRTYEEIFAEIDPQQVVLVTGEEDNEFTPSFDEGDRWDGMHLSGAVGYKETVSSATDLLPPGKYIFELSPEQAAPGGDADLYLGVGAPPPISSIYKCPSYKLNSNERCLITLTKPSVVYLKTRGDKSSQSSAYEVRGWERYQ